MALIVPDMPALHAQPAGTLVPLLNAGQGTATEVKNRTTESAVPVQLVK